MTLDKARELIDVQVPMGGGYNGNSNRLILAEVSRVHRQSAVDDSILEFGLEQRFGLKPGSTFRPLG